MIHWDGGGFGKKRDEELAKTDDGFNIRRAVLGN
jgi:hypothetical protein